MNGPIVGGYLAGLKLPLAWNLAVFVILIPRYAGDPSSRPATGTRPEGQQQS